MRHIAFLAFAVAFAFSPAFAQTAPEARVQLLWRQTVSTALPDGRVQASVVPIFIQDDEAVVAVSEALDASARPPMRAWIERIGAGGVRWRYELDHLPPATFIETAPSLVAADGRALLAVTFQTIKAPPDGEYGRLLSIDLATGAVDRVVPLRYPRIAAHGKPDDEDRLHVFGALRLQDGRIAIYGGDDVGPYRWWLGLRGADGAFLWDAGAPRRGYGEVHAAREVPGGIELLIQAIAYTPDYRDRHLLVRLDRSGRIVSTTDLMPLSGHEAALVDADKLLLVTPAGDQRRVTLRDGSGKTRELARLSADTSLVDQVGPWLVFADMTGRHWFISADGSRLGAPEGVDAPPVEGRYALDARGRPAKYILQQKCQDEPAQGECRRLELSLAKVQF